MEAIYLGQTEIMISGLLVEVFLWRNSVGNIQWIPANEDIYSLQVDSLRTAIQ